MSPIERYPAEFDRMPHYGAEGCVCGNIATPDRNCPLHAANWIIERLEDQLRGAVAALERIAEGAENVVVAGETVMDAQWVAGVARNALNLLGGQ